MCAYIDQNQSKNFSIANHFLEGETDYVKNSYFKMLAVILQQGKEIIKAQNDLLECMIISAQCDYISADYFRQALEVEIEEYVNFTEQYRDMPAKYRFVLDSLILSADYLSEDQSKLIADFMEALRITKDEAIYLSALAKAILEQDTARYVTNEENRVENISSDIAREYLKKFIKDDIFINDTITILRVPHIVKWLNPNNWGKSFYVTIPDILRDYDNVTDLICDIVDVLFHNAFDPVVVKMWGIDSRYLEYCKNDTFIDRVKLDARNRCCYYPITKISKLVGVNLAEVSRFIIAQMLIDISNMSFRSLDDEFAIRELRLETILSNNVTYFSSTIMVKLYDFIVLANTSTDVIGFTYEGDIKL